MRKIALERVRRAEDGARVPVLVDWKAAMSDAPWSLPKHGSSVVILDENGEERFRASGALSQPQHDRFFEVLRSMLKVPEEQARR